tara:strand:- start:4827 stop:5519 length:693 start_codon:yes stop_codon:yes gene_type:complete
MNIKELKKLITEALKPKSVLLAKPQVLSEANYGRVKRRIEDEKIPFAMLTAFRGDYGKEENVDRNKELKLSLDEAGFSYTGMPGSGYKEGGEEGEVVVEDSILVWEEPRGDKFRTSTSLFDAAKDLAKEFEQDSFLYGGPRNGEPDNPYAIHLYTNDGTIIDEVWAGGEEGYDELFIVDDAAEYWSKIAGKKTQFKEIYDKWKNFKSNSRLDAMKKQYYLNLIEAKIEKN